MKSKRQFQCHTRCDVSLLQFAFEKMDCFVAACYAFELRHLVKFTMLLVSRCIQRVALYNGHKCRPPKGNTAKIMGWIKQIVVIVSLKCASQISFTSHPIL